MKKEPLSESTRFKTALATVLVLLGVLFAPQLGIEVSEELLGDFALGIAGLVSMWIYGRTQRPGGDA